MYIYFGLVLVKVLLSIYARYFPIQIFGEYYKALSKDLASMWVGCRFFEL